MFKKKEENKTLDILLKVFLAVGIVAGICVIAKILYDKYKQKLCLLCDDDGTLHEADIEKSYEVLDAHFEKSECKLKTARRHCGLTQEELAHESGVSLNTIRAYERKSKDINKAQIDIVLRLTKALRCDISELLD